MNLDSVWQPWMLAAHTLVERHRLVLDAMNLFPVPDSDTGFNLLGTLAAAKAETDPQRGARAALDAARGNSGMLLAVWLKSFCGSLGTSGTLTPEALHMALWVAAGKARESVGKPVEGTILLVMDSLAKAEIVGELEEQVRHLANTAATAAAKSSLILEVAKKAGIADAGAAGFFLVVRALAETISGKALAAETYQDLLKVPVKLPERNNQNVGGIELVCTVHLEAGRMAQLRDALESAGDSVVVGQAGKDTWSIHVHGESEQRLVEIIESFAPVRGVNVSSLAADSSR